MKIKITPAPEPPKRAIRLRSSVKAGAFDLNDPPMGCGGDGRGGYPALPVTDQQMERW